MSAQTRRRDCSKCKDPRQLAQSKTANGIFACPQCNRKYERENREGVAADRVLEGLLAAPLLGEATGLHSKSTSTAASAPSKDCD
jgi:hypothetical protein